MFGEYARCTAEPLRCTLRTHVFARMGRPGTPHTLLTQKVINHGVKRHRLFHDKRMTHIRNHHQR